MEDEKVLRKFPSGLVVRTPLSHCMGYAVLPKKKKGKSSGYGLHGNVIILSSTEL